MMEKVPLMREILFGGEATMSIEKLNELNIYHENGWVTGYYVDGYIVGDVVEAGECGFYPEYWVRVKKDSVVQYMLNGSEFD